MRLGKYGKILHYDNVSLGVGNIKRFTFFEFKPFGGVILNIFNTDDQDRFHDHAFGAICIQLKGFYNEEYFYGTPEVGFKLIKQRTISAPNIRYIPRGMFHKIKDSSKNAISLTIMGPWKDSWKEWFDKTNKTITYTWGRKKNE